MQLAAKVDQETEMAHLKKKTFGKKEKPTKTTGSSAILEIGSLQAV